VIWNCPSPPGNYIWNSLPRFPNKAKVTTTPCFSDGEGLQHGPVSNKGRSWIEGWGGSHGQHGEMSIG